MPITFKPKYQAFKIVLMIITSTLMCFGLLETILDITIHGLSGIGIVGLFLMGFGLIMPLMAIVGLYSNIVMDELGISKVLFGKKWKTISWDNVNSIKSYYGKIPTFYQPLDVQFYSITPKTKKHRIFYTGGKISFSDHNFSVEDLIKMLNTYIEKYNIEVLIDIGHRVIKTKKLI